MNTIELTHLFCGEDAWQRFVSIVEKNWEFFPSKELLIREVNGNEDIAKVIAFRVGNTFQEWLNRKIPALDNNTPKWCLENPNNLNGLKELLLRMP